MPDPSSLSSKVATFAEISVSNPAEVSARVRGRVAKWILLIIVILFLTQSLIWALNALGVIAEGLYKIRYPWVISAVCFLSGVLSLFARNSIATGKSLMPVLFAFAGTGLVLFAMPTHLFSYGLPQVVWIPMLVVAATSEFRWIFIMAATMILGLYLRHGALPTFLHPAMLINAVSIVALVATIRWLHDAGIQEAVRSHEQALFAMLHDVLTALPNRRLFVERLVDVQRNLSRDKQGFAVLRVDLEQFGYLNENLGQGLGDSVLKTVAKKLQAIVRQTDTVARIGADDFLVLLPSLPSIIIAEKIATTIVDKIEVPLQIEGKTIELVVRIGLVFVDPTESVDIERILQRAEQAIVAARRQGRARIAISRDSEQALAERRFSLSQALRHAIERQELSLVYQPIVALSTGRVRKAEALLRWNPHDMKPVSPAEFIPIAEANGTIHAIGDWVFATAAQQAKQWRDHGYKDFQISINRSPIQFREDGDGPNPCLTMLSQLHVPADSIVLELTEGVFLEADEHTKERLESLREAGIALSLDDFGTGYSSIGHLHSFDMDVVKIDRRFVQGLAPDSKEYVLCESIITMAHSLGLTVVAEGIETETQKALLLTLGCDFGQGYLLGKPMPAEQFETLLHGNLDPEMQTQEMPMVMTS